MLCFTWVLWHFVFCKDQEHKACYLHHFSCDSTDGTNTIIDFAHGQKLCESLWNDNTICLCGWYSLQLKNMQSFLCNSSIVFPVWRLQPLQVQPSQRCPCDLRLKRTTCSQGGVLTLTWYTYMCLPFGALFRKIWYSDRGVFIRDEGAQIT